MANTFQLKRSSVQGRVPTTSDLSAGELAWNSYDGKLFGLKNDGTAAVVEIGGSGGSSSAFTGATSSTAGAAGLVPAPSAGDQAKYLQADGTWSVPTDTNTTYSNATTSVSGLMSAGDKSKLDNIQSYANQFAVQSSLGTASTSNGNGNISVSTTVYSYMSQATITFNPPDLSVYYKSGSAATLGSLVVDGSIDSGATDYAGYRSDGTNIVLKGDASGRSAIFFQSEKNGTNINHPSDYAYIQYHPYGIDGTTGEANRLVIGVANDSTDEVILQSPYKNGVKISFQDATSGTGGTAYTVWHAGNDGASSGLDADLLDGQQGSYYLDYNNFTNTPSVVSTSSANTFTASQTISTGKATNPNNDDPSTYDRLLFDNSHNSTAEGPNKIELYNDGSSWSAGFGVHSSTMAYYSGDYHRFYDQTGAQGNSANFTELLAFNSSNLTYKGNTIWHGGNDGASSGLDADLLDGQQGSYYLDYNNFTNTPTIPSSSSFIDTSNTNQTKAGRLTLGSTTGYDEGLSIQHVKSSSGYGAIRGYDGTTNNSAIHFFSDSWTSSGTTSGTAGSQGCINLSGSYGVTFGPWNNPHAYVESNILGVRGDGSSTRGSLKLFRDNNNFAVTLAPSNSLATNYTLTLPTGTGSSGQVLKTDGAGNLSWSSSILAAEAVVVNPATGNTNYELCMASGASYTVLNLDKNASLTYNPSTSLLTTPGAVIGGNTYPTVTGSNGQVLTTNGSGTLSWTTVSGGSSGIANVAADTSPQLGGSLHLDGKFIYSDEFGLGGTYGDVAIEPISTISTGHTPSNVYGGLKIRCRDHTTLSSYYVYYFDGPNLSTPGSITATGNVTAYSDIKLKKEIKPIKNALDKVCKINGVTFERTDLETKSRFAGVIAQEVEQILPEVVSTDEQGFKSVAYGNLVGLLVEAIKEQQTQIDSLRKAIKER